MVFLLAVALIAFVVLLILGCAVALVLFLVGSGVTILGVTATSAISAWMQKSPAAGLRTLIFQLGALAGVPLGALSAWIWAARTGMLDGQEPLSPPFGILLLGALVGAAMGLLAGALFVLIWSRILAVVRARLASRRPASQPSLPTAR